eukprot:scaffold23343_cov129-Isochrysis_galbana.AAC.2
MRRHLPWRFVPHRRPVVTAPLKRRCTGPGYEGERTLLVPASLRATARSRHSHPHRRRSQNSGD